MNKPLLLLLLSLAAWLPACAFIEAAGDVEIPSDSIPHAQMALKWPSVDDLLGKPSQQSGDGQVPPAGLPTSFQSASLAHMQGLMTIEGQCKVPYSMPDPVDPKSPIRNVRIEVINCGNEGRCAEQCKDDFGDPFRGMRLGARVQFNLINAAAATQIQTTLQGQTNPDVLAEIRLRFSKLAFMQDFTDPATGKTSAQNIDSLFSGFELGAGSAALPGEPTPDNDDTPIVKYRYLNSISPDTPQRFELDPTSAFSHTLRKAIIAGSQVWIDVYLRVDVPEQNLYAVRLNGGGVDIDFQPEIVISFAKALTGAL